MKIAILSEDESDEFALQILVEAILGEPVERPTLPPLRGRGWPSVRDDLAGVLTGLHYRSDAEALVMVVDSDDEPLHDDHCDDVPCSKEKHGNCRHCELTRIIESTQRRLTPRRGRPPIKVALGIATPLIEAWYLSGQEPRATEAMWIQAGRHHNRLDLKEWAYGTSRANRARKMECAQAHLHRVVEDLDSLRLNFQCGFVPLYDAVYSWRPQEGEL